LGVAGSLFEYSFGNSLAEEDGNLEILLVRERVVWQHKPRRATGFQLSLNFLNQLFSLKHMLQNVDAINEIKCPVSR
jgi:hypothetical protein